MAGSNVETVRQGYEAWNRGDREWILEHMAPGFQWRTPPDDPDPGIHLGHEGVEHYWDAWREAFGQLKIEIEELMDAGDKVAAFVRRLGIGEVSGVEVQERVIQVFTFEGGKAVRCEEFYDRRQGLEAAGLAQRSERSSAS
ncbi:MAG: nuclear transport factor 2 family protein [Thermoleophilaceae bacterium]